MTEYPNAPLCTAMLLIFALGGGCAELARRHEAAMAAHYRSSGPAPMATAAIARRQAAVERRELMRELRAIRAAFED